ncbi:otoferlin-like isoform X3 [Lineus longissimus]|uniref:otoferlin-like isoform X3 n=1 Tax=Lineus longissimus TaxID=88925 RepID=UPI00315D5F98
MALVLKLNYVDNLKGKTAKVARASYRDFSVLSSVVRCQNGTAFFGETMSWPMASAVEPNDTVKIEIFNFNKYFSKKLVGTFTMVLQSIMDEPIFKAAEPLLNAHNQALQSKVYFELNYMSPDGNCGTWTPDDIMKEGGSGGYDAPDGGSEMDYNLDDVLDRESEAENEHRSVKFNPNIGVGGGSKMSSSDDDSMLDDMVGVGQLGGKKFPSKLEPTLDKVQDYQVNIGIYECRVAVGLKFTISPLVKIDIIDQCKRVQGAHTTLQGGGEKPEGLLGMIAGSRYKPSWMNVNKLMNKKTPRKYFVFDFHTTKAELFDQVIQLTAVATSKSIPGFKRGQKIGIFKIDVGTVYAAQDHMFYHKWAVLVDPDDGASGVKGYLKCDLSVTGKGEQVKTPTTGIAGVKEIVPKNLKDDEDDEDIEANLLLPVGVSVDRQMAEIAVKIYRAEDLPQMYSDVMASVRKAIIGDNKALVDPYVAVNFAGQKGRTSSCKNTYNPLFNEAIVFRDIFPPLCNRIKLQLLDEDALKDEVIATHYIDLHQIMYPGESGFLPQMGPCWINFYGAPRGQTLKDKMEKHNEMNLGQGEGSAYRGRLMIAIKTELIEADEYEAIQNGVDVSQANPVSDSVCGVKEDFTLFCTVIDASMLCMEVTGGKEVTLELSIGVLGNELDGQGYGRDEGKDPPTDAPRVLPAISTLVPMKPVTGDNIHYRLPIEEEKPVLYQTIPWEDHRRRFYITNMLEKIADKMADGLADARDAFRRENSRAYKRLKRTLRVLNADITTYLMYSRGSSGGAGVKTKLDKDRKKLCETQMERVATKAERIRKEVCFENMKYKMRESRAVLNTIRHLAKEPQHGLPDIFIWMICNKKRIAYARIQARDIIYSTCEEEKGKDCGVVRTLFLKFPGKKGLGEAAWVIPAKLQLFMWLGIDRGRKEYMTTLPKGYDIPKPLKGQKKRPPSRIIYKDKFTFTLNAYMFLCRGLIGSDDSGLSDPFARVICFDRCVTTRICPETLSPCWDQLLTIDNVDIYFGSEDIKVDPPMIIIEIFDHDDVGDPEFLGRAIAKPHIYMLWDEYEPPQLQWWEVYRAQFKGGELLACFELVQVGEDGQLPPFCPPSPRDMFIKDQIAKGKKEKDIKLIPIPRPIRPSVCKYRMEVLFWGVRDMLKLFLMSVDRPRVDVECGGQIVSSTVITSAKVKPNFEDPVQYIDLELPENSMFWPPIMIRCVDQRQFGRMVIAGTHVINHIDKFVTGEGGEKELSEYYDSTSMCTTTQMPDGSIVVSRISNGSVQTDSFNVPEGDQKSASFPLLDQRSLHSLAIPSDNRSIHSGVEGSIHSGRPPSSLHRQALTNSLKQLPEYDTTDNRSIRSGQFDSRSIHSLPREGDRLSLYSQRGVSPDRTSLHSQRALSSEHVSRQSGQDPMSVSSKSRTSTERLSGQGGPQDCMSLHSQSGTSPERLSLRSGSQDRMSVHSQSLTSTERLSGQGGAQDRMSLHSQSGTSPERLSLRSGSQDRMSVHSQSLTSTERLSRQGGTQDRMSMHSQSGTSPEHSSLHSGAQDRMSMHSQSGTSPERSSLHSGAQDQMSMHSQSGLPSDSMSVRSGQDRMSMHSRNSLSPDRTSLAGQDSMSVRSGQDRMSIRSSQDRTSVQSQGSLEADHASLHSQQVSNQDRMSLKSGTPERSSGHSSRGSVLGRMSLRSQKSDSDRVSLISENEKNLDNVSRRSGLSYKNKQLMTIEESRRLSSISESGKSRTGSLHPSQAGSQGRLDAIPGSQLGSKAGSRTGSRVPSLTGSQADLAKGDAVAIDMEGKEGGSAQTTEVGADGMPPPPVKEDIPTGDPTLLPELEPLLSWPSRDNSATPLPPGNGKLRESPPSSGKRFFVFERPPKKEPECKPETMSESLHPPKKQKKGFFHFFSKKKRKEKKDEPKDADELDWWSKYYVTLEDLVAENKEDAEKKAQSESSDDDDEDDERNEMLDDVGPGFGLIQLEGMNKIIKKRKKRRKKRLKRMEEQLKKVKIKDKQGGENVKYEDDNADDEKALIERIKFYRCELENVSGFNTFEEWLQKFPLLRGKKLDDEEEDDSRCSGFFKGTLNIYRIGAVDEEITPPTKNELKLMKNLPSNEPVEVKIRIYIIRANDLHPADTNGKADPYMCITLGKQVLNDKKNYISKQLNPVFGKCFEMEAVFPMESMLTLSVIDWDMAGSDDLIGETKIDLENRFYSQHRPAVGLASKFEIYGYNKWRDPVKPMAILSAICKERGLPEPKYESNANRVKVGPKYFVGPNMVKDEHGEQKISNEPLALEALKHFHDVPRHGTKLVPEHIETRALFTPEKPGVEQGKLELWIDMFPKSNPPDSPPVDISPRLPKSYELRVIIWNCDEVELEDTNMFSGEASSDIFVKGWLKGFGQDDQATDVHYNSMTGEGNFNWRFVYPFDYLKSEDKIVIKQKESIFSVDETEYKIQPRLYIQCWDADIVSSDDFIGSFMLHLSKFPRAAKSVKSCKKEMLNTDGSQPQISIFKNRRVKGWYPFVALDETSGEMELKGKCELEMHLVTHEEAETGPVGLARNEPEPLTAPKRPNYSFLNLLNPLRLVKVLLRRYRCCLIKLILIILAIFFLLVFFYSLPGYTVKKILGA